MRISDWSSDVCSSDLLSLADAYHIQDALRLIQIGGHASPAGLKMGFTSRAKMAQMKVKDPINGYLTEGGRLPVGGTVRRSDFILPRVEAEIAVVDRKSTSLNSSH